MRMSGENEIMLDREIIETLINTVNTNVNANRKEIIAQITTLDSSVKSYQDENNKSILKTAVQLAEYKVRLEISEKDMTKNFGQHKEFYGDIDKLMQKPDLKPMIKDLEKKLTLSITALEKKLKTNDIKTDAINTEVTKAKSSATTVKVILGIIAVLLSIWGGLVKLGVF